MVFKTVTTLKEFINIGEANSSERRLKVIASDVQS
jgi:hypothetical protein